MAFEYWASPVFRCPLYSDVWYSDSNCICLLKITIFLLNFLTVACRWSTRHCRWSSFQSCRSSKVWKFTSLKVPRVVSNRWSRPDLLLRLRGRPQDHLEAFAGKGIPGKRYSRDLNTEHAWILNGLKYVGCQMVWNLNSIWIPKRLTIWEPNGCLCTVDLC